MAARAARSDADVSTVARAGGAGSVMTPARAAEAGTVMTARAVAAVAAVAGGAMTATVVSAAQSVASVAVKVVSGAGRAVVSNAENVRARASTAEMALGVDSPGAIANRSPVVRMETSAVVRRVRVAASAVVTGMAVIAVSAVMIGVRALVDRTVMAALAMASVVAASGGMTAVAAGTGTNAVSAASVTARIARSVRVSVTTAVHSTVNADEGGRPWETAATVAVRTGVAGAGGRD